MGFKAFYRLNQDIIELARGYIGAFLITIDAIRGWKITNYLRMLFFKY